MNLSVVRDVTFGRLVLATTIPLTLFMKVISSISEAIAKSISSSATRLTNHHRPHLCKGLDGISGRWHRHPTNQSNYLSSVSCPLLSSVSLLGSVAVAS